jgi:large conductance mechanosensitive channel
MWKEFKAFAMKGNVIDLAVGVIIGGAFGKIVTSLVSDVIMPFISLILGKIDFTNLFIVLGPGKGKAYDTLEKAQAAATSLAEAQKNSIPVFAYGSFINNIINFLIIAFSIFIVIKQIGRFTKKKEEPAPKTTKQCRYCYSEIHIDATKCPHCTSALGKKQA